MPNQKYYPQELYLATEPGKPGNREPLVSYFAGIFVRVHLGDEQPRLHVKYSKEMAVFDFEGKLLEGGLPEKQQKYIAVWADLRYTELMVLWEIMQREDTHIYIRGLD